MNWANVRNYLIECDNFAAEQSEDVKDIPAIDESITRGIAGLREVYNIDLDDETQVYALTVGFCIAYRYGCQVAMGETRDVEGAQHYLRRHGPISGHIGLVARAVIRNLGVVIPPADTESE